MVAAPPADNPRLVVLDTQVHGTEIEPVVGQSLSAVIAAEVVQRAGDRYQVVSRNDVRVALAQAAQEQLAGCGDECAQDVARAVAAAFVLSSTLTKVGEDWVLTLALVETGMSEVKRRQVARYRGDSAGLVEVVRPYITRMFDTTAAEGHRGNVDIVVTEEDAQVLIGEVDLGISPVRRAVDLTIGTHRVRVNKAGFVPFEGDVVINTSETSVLTVDLIDEDTLRPWYRKWWVWTSAGAVAVAVTTTVAILARGSGGSLTLDDRPLPQ